jgi:hypothetical protein
VRLQFPVANEVKKPALGSIPGLNEAAASFENQMYTHSISGMRKTADPIKERPMPQNKWTINIASGGNSASSLVGCHIKQTSTGYDFTSSSNTVLASTTSTTVPFSFTGISLASLTWTVTVDSLANPATGGWSNSQPKVTEEEGTWSAGATIDVDSEDASSVEGGEEAAAS